MKNFKNMHCSMVCLAPGDNILGHNSHRIADDPKLNAAATAWFWNNHNLNLIADSGNATKLTHAINGGYNGLAERQAMYHNACQVFGVK